MNNKEFIYIDVTFFIDIKRKHKLNIDEFLSMYITYVESLPDNFQTAVYILAMAIKIRRILK